MYIYDDFDRTLVDERVREFRDQVARRLSGELTEEEFKPLRLMNGVYLQLHAYMLRIAIPYGTLCIKCQRESENDSDWLAERRNANWEAVSDGSPMEDREVRLSDLEMDFSAR